MNIDIDTEKLKGAKVTIPIVAVVACAVFVWNISRNFTDFQESVATDDDISELQELIEEGQEEMMREISSNDKRILILEITTGSPGIMIPAPDFSEMGDAAEIEEANPFFEDSGFLPEIDSE